MSDEVKPGWKTTEFWKSLGTQIVGVLAVAAILVPLLSYSNNRTAIKVQSMKNANTN